MSQLPTRVGGSFAPPVDKDMLEAYRAAAESAPAEVQEAIGKLADMVEHFQKTPRSKARGSPHPSGAPILITPLEEAEVKRIWDHVPWETECDMYQRLFDALPVGAKGSAEANLRNAAFHLLWFAKELSRGREPLTNDQLKR